MPTNASFDYSSSTVPPGTVFVAADEPLLVFPSVAAGEQYLEVADVRAGTYPAAYGPQGEPYRIDSDGNHVRIMRAEGPDQPDELRHLLARYLEAVGQAYNQNSPLEDLAATVWARESDFWQKHDPYGDRFGTRIPLLGCVGFVILLAAIIWLAVRLH